MNLNVQSIIKMYLFKEIDVSATFSLKNSLL